MGHVKTFFTRLMQPICRNNLSEDRENRERECRKHLQNEHEYFFLVCIYISFGCLQVQET